MDQLLQMKGKQIYSSEGEKIGKFEDLYIDDETQEPEWIGLGAGLFGNKHLLVPVEGAQPERDGLRVPYSKDQVKDTPNINEDQVSEEQERQLYEHYGLNYGYQHSESGLPQGERTERPRDTRPEMQDRDITRPSNESMTVSGEEMRVGKRETTAGRVRLRKFVDTRPVEENVRLREERARVQREPINQPVQDAEIGEREIDVELSREEPVIEKQTVARERVSLDRDTQERTETVRGEVREERVEIDEDEEDWDREDIR